MRTSLLPGLAAALGRNAARQQPRVRLFEFGNVFHAPDAPGDAPLHTQRVAAVACGPGSPEHWAGSARPVGFHDLKGDLESLAAHADAALVFEPSRRPWAHPGRSADVLLDQRTVGWIGELHPRLLQTLGLDAAVVAFEIDLAAVQNRAIPRAGSLSRYPSVRRDLAFVVADSTPWWAIEASVRSVAGASLRDLVLFDVYRGKGVETGFRSVAMGLILQEKNRTLTDRDVDAVVGGVVSSLQREHGATIRS